jgi:hypothetical protein
LLSIRHAFLPSPEATNVRGNFSDYFYSYFLGSTVQNDFTSALPSSHQFILPKFTILNIIEVISIQFTETHFSLFIFLHLASFSIISSIFASPKLTSPQLRSVDLSSNYLTLSHFTSPHLSSNNVTSHRLTSPHHLSSILSFLNSNQHISPHISPTHQPTV